MLSQTDLTRFADEGFIRIPSAFPPAVAEAVVDRLWQDIPFNRSDPDTWTAAVVRLGMYDTAPFVESVNTPVLHAAFDRLVGMGRWIPPRSVGTFPVRFPADDAPGDTGRHVDASFPGDDPADYMRWRVNVHSRGRALLMLLLYSDVSDADAPTVVYPGSHRDVARLLQSEGEAGLSFTELAARLEGLPERKPAYATGEAGTVYLCHPFLVHAAQTHRGTTPKFMAQPPLVLRGEFALTGAAEDCAPVERAIRMALL